MTTRGKICWICSSANHVDRHHLDCWGGKVSPETVLLCRRCHRTYHDWGVSSFSPDTTLKALEIENKRREILRSLPPDHLFYRSLSPMKPEDIRRSGYWYKKWGISPPQRERVKVATLPFKLPNAPSLCDDEWLHEHMHDHSPEEIGTLAIEVTCGGKQITRVIAASKRGTLKKMLREVEDGAGKSQGNS